MEKIKNALIKNLWLIELITLALCIGFSSMKGFDHDILWHYKLGEEIINTKNISINDTLSWQPGLIWIQHEWLYDIFIYFIIKYTDLIGFLILFILNLSALFIVGSKTCKPKYPLFYTMICFLLFYLLPKNAFNRPAEFSVWFVMFILDIYDKQFKHKRLVMMLMTLLFANFHGGIIITSLALYLVMMCIDIAFNILNQINKAETKKLIKEKLIDVILLTLTGLINPSGLELYETSLQVSGFETTSLIREWSNLTLGYGGSILVLLIVLAFGYHLKKDINNRKTFRLVGIGCALLVLSFVSLKAALLFIYFIIFFGCNFIEDFVFSYIKLDRFKKENIEVIGYFLVSLLCLYASFQYFTFQSKGIFDFESKVKQKQPDKIMEYLSENMKDNDTLYNYYNEGQYLIWNGIKCFLDSRHFMYTKEKGNGTFDEIVNINSKQELIDYVHKYNFDYIWVHDDDTLWMWVMEHLVDMNEYSIVVIDILDENEEETKDNVVVKHFLYKKTVE